MTADTFLLSDTHHDESTACQVKSILLHFSRSDFIFDAVSDTYTCPGGKILQQYRRPFTIPRTGVTKDKMRLYRARQSDCEACPLKARCPQGQVPSRPGALKARCPQGQVLSRTTAPQGAKERA